MIQKTRFFALVLFFTPLCFSQNPTVVDPNKDTVNFCHRQRIDKYDLEPVDPCMIILNYSQKETLEQSHNSFRRNGLSIHYTVDTDGKVYETIGETPKEVNTINPEYLKQRAWHAGLSYWNATNKIVKDVNTHSIGILLVNKASNNNQNPDYQIGNPENTTVWYDFTQPQY